MFLNFFKLYMLKIIKYALNECNTHRYCLSLRQTLFQNQPKVVLDCVLHFVFTVYSKIDAELQEWDEEGPKLTRCGLGLGSTFLE